jgi:ABC-type protease/lipase transport system fused ATPase/permease subunit
MLGVCDKLLVLQNGRAEAFGPRDQVLSQLTRSADGGVAKPHNPNIRAVE